MRKRPSSSLPFTPIDRRTFLQTSTVAITAAALGPAILRGQNLNSRVGIGVIGANGKGASDTSGCAEAGADIVALCDIDSKRLRGPLETYSGAEGFADYREMLERNKDIDAVVVSTPDHIHAPAAMMAIKMGKHAYVQKPLTHSVYEARQLQKAAREHKVATMMGNQGHASEGVRRFCELIWAGAIGPVREVHAWSNRPIWPQGMHHVLKAQPVPEHVDWNLFLGPAPERPYNADYHPFKWRGWWDFGTGALGDMGCHILDGVNWALKLKHPETIEAESSEVTEQAAPEWSRITYQFPARDEMPAVKIVWHDGGRKPGRELVGEVENYEDMNGGVLLIGDKGKILTGSYGSNPRFTSDSGAQEMPNPPKTLPRSSGHYVEWIRACQGEPNTGANFDYAAPFTEWILLGNAALRAGQPIHWNGEQMKITNAPEAERFIRRPYREGWSL